MSPAIDAPTDLGDRSDVHDLVVAFYREVVFDDLLAPVFGEVAEVDWAVHIPKLIDYWCRVLFGEPGYQGYLLGAHQHVHEIEPLRVEHVDRWFELWVATIEARWSGPVADQAGDHASQIAAILARRLLGVDWQPSIARWRGAGRPGAAQPPRSSARAITLNTAPPGSSTTAKRP